ncbi:MAG: type IV toxin-antitoxin system AbiEi family antitoxin domain-containing protein [Nocardioidaceae bacterium]|nr:type IV toxin-antitoxin system AbiEi family antitoxin domain-containing protein [Nocardioidaceae bacterium]
MAAPFSSLDPVTGLLPAEHMVLLGRPFTHLEAVDAGITPRVLRRMVREGEVRRVLRGVYVDSATGDNLSLRSEALAKVLPRDAVVCDRTAAWLHGADILGPDGRLTVPPIEVFRTNGGSRIRRAGCAGGTRSLDLDRDITEVNGILTTNPLRTALDLGRLLKRGEAIGAMDAMMRAGGFTREDLARELPRFKGARWVRQLRRLVPLVDGRSESPAESLTRLRLIDAGLPAPELQWKVCNAAGIVIYRLDLAYPGIMLAIEYDGEEFHTSAEQQARDEQRRARLRRMGWTVVVLRRRHVYGANATAAHLVLTEMRRLCPTN